MQQLMGICFIIIIIIIIIFSSSSSSSSSKRGPTTGLDDIGHWSLSTSTWSHI